jgi:hypothetical protein
MRGRRRDAAVPRVEADQSVGPWFVGRWRRKYSEEAACHGGVVAVPDAAAVVVRDQDRHWRCCMLVVEFLLANL